MRRLLPSRRAARTDSRPGGRVHGTRRPRTPGCANGAGTGRPVGLTLLEVVVTITILTSVTLGMTLVLVPIARQSRINRETTIANAEARRIIERILALPFREIVPTYPDESEITVGDLPDGTLSVSYVDPTSDPLEIHLDMHWTSPDMGSVSVEFVTVRTE